MVLMVIYIEPEGLSVFVLLSDIVQFELWVYEENSTC